MTVEHFQLLRRQWAGRAQLLVTTLDEIADADMTAVSGKDVDCFRVDFLLIRTHV